MARMDSFVEYTVELLEKLGPVQARRMFGGWGLYFGGRMFGLIGDGQLYLKTDEVSRPEFQAAGCRPFVWEGGGQRIEMSYWTPPADASDDAYALLPWARRGVDAATRAALKKAPKKKAAAKKTPAEPAKKTAAPRKATKTPAKKAPAQKPSATKKPAAKKTSTARKAKPSSRRR
ncbi:TfoX/Sxy family protein [Myxococcus sp. K38C18041901]|uniref:TfoX/Sxy family protein n=1 Tax=Myxococcus guangdongensis TaxID=2906760 RepID=UPI0020A80FD8|nr:TfoX/Sxy family protein [Myxococcus guangdongensis]MCP3064241.1 TfoX/Sxy family protein [Myxococcus guangdongensis]